jgi:hypothetical protein
MCTFIYVSSSDCKDHVHNLLHVHVCNAVCILNAIVFKLLKHPSEGMKTDCGMHNQSLDVRSTTLLVRQNVRSRCA